MAYLNSKATAQIANALRDAANVYETLSHTDALPLRLRSEFSAQRHMAETLADLFEAHPAINAEGVDPKDYNALIWENR